MLCPVRLGMRARLALSSAAAASADDVGSLPRPPFSPTPASRRLLGTATAAAADTMCIAAGGRLASFSSAEDLQGLHRACGTSGVWVGLNDQLLEAGTSRSSPNWVFASGESSAWARSNMCFWNDGEPSSSFTTEDCVSGSNTADGLSKTY